MSMGVNRIKHGLKELNVYDKSNSLVLIEIFKDRNGYVSENHQCIQMSLDTEEVKDLIKILEKTIK